MSAARMGRISVLGLAKVRYPGAQATSGAAQDYMRKLDTLFRPGGFLALIEQSPDGFRVMPLDESQVFNIPQNALVYVLRSWEQGG